MARYWPADISSVPCWTRWVGCPASSHEIPALTRRRSAPPRCYPGTVPEPAPRAPSRPPGCPARTATTHRDPRRRREAHTADLALGSVRLHDHCGVAGMVDLRVSVAANRRGEACWRLICRSPSLAPVTGPSRSAARRGFGAGRCRATWRCRRGRCRTRKTGSLVAVSIMPPCWA